MNHALAGAGRSVSPEAVNFFPSEVYVLHAPRKSSAAK